MQVDKVCAAIALLTIFASVVDAAVYSQPAIFHPGKDLLKKYHYHTLGTFDWFGMSVKYWECK